MVNFLIANVRLLSVKPKINKLNKKYFATVRSDWEQKKYDETVYFYPIHKIDECIKGKGKVNFLTGLKLALASPNKQKIEIVLAWFTQEDIELIKTYVILRGFDVVIVKAD
jgi:hypothetical protein